SGLPASRVALLVQSSGPEG
ncbi:hypothetical protein AB1N83_013956, partial [Pleurotus pulmonarius]